MTRGYVVITKGGKVIKYGYLNSDAYTSWYGKRILQKVACEEISEYVDDIIKDNHACYGNEEPNPDFSLDWIRKGKNNKEWKKYDFMEYGYLYEENTGVLRVYNLGKLLYRITPEETEKYLYLFSNENKIMDILTYDSEKLMYDEEKVTRKMIEAFSLADIVELVKEWRIKHDNMIVVDVYNYIARGWGSREYPVYSRWVRFGSERNVEFLIEKNRLSNKWDVLIQFPYMRAIVRSGISSARAATEAVRDIVKSNKKTLERTAEIMDDIEYKSKTADKHEFKSYLSCLPKLWFVQPWYTAEDAFAVEKIQKYYAWEY